jgi:hypothetical protein
MTDDPVKLLVQEVEDLLPAGRVGLYEFMWILHSEKVPGSKNQHREIAHLALARLIKAGDARLITLIWAQPGSEEKLARDVRDDDFDDPQQNIPYVAVTRD